MVVHIESAESTDRVFRALSDPTRRDIVRTVLARGQSVSLLATRYPMSFAAVQKHVAVLTRAGLVDKERQGREQIVRARVESIRQARLVLQELEDLWRARIDAFGKVLSDETNGDAL